jgi:DNA-binding transcriptional ArsR family regulator
LRSGRGSVAGDSRPVASGLRQQRSRDRTLSDGAIEMVACRCRLFGEPMRIRLLEALDEADGSVRRLADRLHATEADVAAHLSVLHEAGVVSRRSEGVAVIYGLIDWTGLWLIERLSASATAQIDGPGVAEGEEPPCE